jgi:hypothetical protein
MMRILLMKQVEKEIKADMMVVSEPYRLKRRRGKCVVPTFDRKSSGCDNG